LVIDSFSSAGGSNAALSTILDRLQRLEAQTVAGPPSTNGQSIPTPSGDGSEVSSSPVAFSTTGHESSALTPHNPDREMDAMTVLKDAVDQVQELRKRSFGSTAITSSIDIPTDLAKTWVASTSSPMQSSMLADVVRLLSAHACLYVPRLIGQTHHRLDSRHHQSTTHPR